MERDQGEIAARTHGILGDIYLEWQNPRQAFRHYERSLQLDPSFAPVLVKRGHALLLMGKKKEAEEDFEKASRLELENTQLKRKIEKLREAEEG